MRGEIIINCIYFYNKKCISSKSAYYKLRCGGSAHYLEYTELSEENKVKKASNKKDNEPYWYD